jgi:hypothetical protein
VSDKVSIKKRISFFISLPPFKWINLYGNGACYDFWDKTSIAPYASFCVGALVYGVRSYVAAQGFGGGVCVN